MPTPGLPAALAVLVALTSLAGCGEPGSKAAPKGTARRNVLLFVGDGMGPAHVEAAGIYANGAAGTLRFESFPFQGTVSTLAAAGAITDSAAAATAMATGVKVDNGVVSVALPGDGGPLPTALETLAARGLATGLLSTVDVTDATPAAFGAHAASRALQAEIAAGYLSGSRPDLILGGSSFLTAEAATGAGYVVVGDAADLHAVPAGGAARVAGIFGDGADHYELDGIGSRPHLAEATAKALSLLEADPEGFFLLVEGGLIDHASHANDLGRMVPEVLELERAVAVAEGWAAGRDDTLIVVVADHETGGLTVTGNLGAGTLPTVTWSSTGHTATQVPIYATGLGAEAAAGSIENTALRAILLGE